MQYFFICDGATPSNSSFQAINMHIGKLISLNPIQFGRRGREFDLIPVANAL